MKASLLQDPDMGLPVNNVFKGGNRKTMQVGSAEAASQAREVTGPVMGSIRLDAGTHRSQLNRGHMSGLPAEKAIKSRPGLDPEESSPSAPVRGCGNRKR